MGKKTMVSVSQKDGHFEATVPEIGATVLADSLDDVLRNAEQKIVEHRLAEAERTGQQSKQTRGRKTQAKKAS